VTLLDRNEPGAAALLRRVVVSEAFPLSTRAIVVRSINRWDSDNAVATLSQIVSETTDQGLAESAASGLMSLRSSEGYEALVSAYRDIEDAELRYTVLEAMQGRGVSDLLGFLSEVALGDDDRAAAIAIENIAGLENDVAVTTLRHIYFNTSSSQRHLAVIHGMGEAESAEAVSFLSEILEQQVGAEFQLSILRALGESDLPLAVEPVMNVWRNSPDTDIKNAAVRALRQLDDHPRARDYLFEVLESQLDSVVTQ